MRVLVVDDYPVIRRMLMRFLDFESDCDVVGEAENGQIAIDMTRKLSPDVVLMDVNMPVMNGIEATRRIRTEFPEVQVIGFSTFISTAEAKPLLDAGAVGHVSKTAALDQVLATVRSFASAAATKTLSPCC